MKPSNPAAAHILFDLATALMGDEFDKALAFLASVSPEKERAHKAECEETVRSLLTRLAKLPDDESLTAFRAGFMREPFITRAYLVCWLGEAAQRLSSTPEISHSNPTVQLLLDHLLQPGRPFWD